MTELFLIENMEASGLFISNANGKKAGVTHWVKMEKNQHPRNLKVAATSQIRNR